MTRKKIALFAIPTCAVLIALGVFSVNFSENELTPSSDTPYEIQNEIMPQAYAMKPNFQVLSGTQLVSPEFLEDNDFLIQELECKIKEVVPFEESQVMWCFFAGEIDTGAALFVVAQLPPQNILSFTNNVIQAGPSSQNLIAFGIIEALNAEIEKETGLDLSGVNGFEIELNASFESNASVDVGVSWKIKEMWS